MGESFDSSLLKQLYLPPSSSHKGENGKLMVIGGSHLFHAAVLWSLQIASKVVDMVFFSSVPENNEIVQKAKSEFRNGILVPRKDIEHYIKEADCVLIGPGLMRTDTGIKNQESRIKDISGITQIRDEGEQTYYLTKYLLKKYPDKKWVVDGGSLQMLDPDVLLGLEVMPVLTPHTREFEMMKLKIKNEKLQIAMQNAKGEEQVELFAKNYHAVVLLKGEIDVISNGKETIVVEGGNAGMTKGGTGDVLAGLIAALGCKNDLWLAALAGSYFNKKAGDALFEKVGYYFNASDLADEIPKVMKEEIL